MLELDVALEVVVACVDLIAQCARERLGLVRQLVALKIMFACESLRAAGKRASEGAVVEMLVPNMVVQMVKPLPAPIFGYIIERIDLLCSSLNAAVADQAPPTTVTDLCQVSGDERSRDGSLGMGLHVFTYLLCRSLLVG